MNEQEIEKEISSPSPFTPIDQHLFESRTVFVTGVVTSELSHKINRELLALDKTNPNTPIILWINSPGGEVDSGFAIYDMIQFIRPKVITVIAGMAASMGSVISLAAEKENRLALPNAHILIHQPLIGGVIRGQASDIDIHAKRIIELKKKMHKLYSERTGTPVETYQELMERDKSLNVDEAIKLGLISKKISSRNDLDKMMK